jgi:hypothetical protein
MNDDTFKELPISEKLEHLLMISEDLAARCARRGASASALLAKDTVTNPLWAEIWNDQQLILGLLQEQSARMDRIEARMDEMEAHLQRQDEKMEDGFRKLNDKFEIMSEEWFETRADLKHLKRRVTQLETINQ